MITRFIRLVFFSSFSCQYVFVTINPAASNSATTHEVLATTVTAILKQTADFNTSNKLLKVLAPVSSPVSCSTSSEQQVVDLLVKWAGYGRYFQRRGILASICLYSLIFLMALFSMQ